MAFDGLGSLTQSLPAQLPAQLPAEAQVIDRRDDFRRLERLVVLTGGASIGAVAGFFAAMSIGPMPVWQLIAITAPAMAMALYLLTQTLSEGIKRNAYGCISAAIMHAAALLAWPVTSLFVPLSVASFWIAPVAAAATLVLFASCWKGAPRAIYRLGLQGALVGALVAHQGLLVMLGN